MTQTRDGRFKNKSVCPYSSIIQSTQLYQGYIEFGLGIEVLQYLAIFFCGIAVFAEIFCGIAVFRTPQCPPPEETR